jgi:hypothetical protein
MLASPRGPVCLGRRAPPVRAADVKWSPASRSSSGGRVGPTHDIGAVQPELLQPRVQLQLGPSALSGLLSPRRTSHVDRGLTVTELRYGGLAPARPTVMAAHAMAKARARRKTGGSMGPLGVRRRWPAVPSDDNRPDRNESPAPMVSTTSTAGAAPPVAVWWVYATQPSGPYVVDRATGGGQTCNGLASWLRRIHAYAGRARRRMCPSRSP